MHCWFVLFVMEGVSGAEGEREVRRSGKDYSESISKLQCNQTNITHSSTNLNTILIKLNYSYYSDKSLNYFFTYKGKQKRNKFLQEMEL